MPTELTLLELKTKCLEFAIESTKGTGAHFEDILKVSQKFYEHCSNTAFTTTD